MKFLFSLFLLTLSFHSFAESGGIEIVECKTVSNIVKPELNGNSRFVFHLLNTSLNPENSNTFQICNSLDSRNIWQIANLDTTASFSMDVVPGKYLYKIVISDRYYQFTADGLDIAANSQLEIDVMIPLELILQEKIQVTLCKPVVYLHTSESREFDISVQPKEAFSFVYPQMDGSWKGTAQPNGNISVNGLDYPYLFWESKQNYVFKSEGNGYKVEKSEVITFLEKKLTELGLNQQEKTDFITYWGPKLMENETSFVQFSVDDMCDQFATMTCTPKPNAVRRVYIQIAEWEPGFDAYLKDVTFSSVQQGDWYIVEWGGFSFSIDHVALNEN